MCRGKFESQEGGYCYEGEWRKGLKHGQGTMSFPSGDSYQGDWWQDQRHGTRASSVRVASTLSCVLCPVSCVPCGLVGVS